MYFLNDMCDSSAVLRLFYVIKLAFYALQIILPLLCIFIMMKRCFSALISDDTQKKLKDLTPQTLKMLAAAFIFFFVPVIVEYAINGLGENDVDFASCFVEAELDNIKSLEEQELSSVSDEREQTKEELDAVYKKKQEEAEKKYAAKVKEDEDNNSNNTNTTTNTSNNNVTQSNGGAVSNNSNILTSGKEGKYFAPIQNNNYLIGVKNYTGSCTNEVYHDAPVATGTPIYAGMDGTVTYYQYACGTILYGYGNLAVLTGTDGTFIRYAHLSRFANGYQTTYTETCPKKGNTVPCPSDTCDVTMTVLKVGTVDVKKGQIIGYSGDTGNSTGPHLHVEIHENGSNVCVPDPFKAFGMR